VKEERRSRQARGAINFAFTRATCIGSSSRHDGKPVAYASPSDAATGDDHGADINAQGEGVVTGGRLYQLLRQQGAIGDRLFRIEFRTPRARLRLSLRLKTGDLHASLFGGVRFGALAASDWLCPRWRPRKPRKFPRRRSQTKRLGLTPRPSCLRAAVF